MPEPTAIAKQIVDTAAQVAWWDLYSNEANWIGLGITVVGFALTLFSVRKSRNAAEAAREAADNTLKSIGKVDAIAALSFAIRTLSELPEMHRNGIWTLTPRQLREVRISLVSARSSASTMSAADRQIVHSAILQIRTLIDAAENKISDPAMDTSRVGPVLDEQSLSLSEVLGRMRSQAG
jgi:hypothetical protein